MKALIKSAGLVAVVFVLTLGFAGPAASLYVNFGFIGCSIFALIWLANSLARLIDSEGTEPIFDGPFDVCTLCLTIAIWMVLKYSFV